MDEIKDQSTSVRGKLSVSHASFTRILKICAPGLFASPGEVTDRSPCLAASENRDIDIIDESDVRVARDAGRQASG